MIDVTIITPTIPGRESSLLPRAIKSVYDQTIQPSAYLITAERCIPGVSGQKHVADMQNKLLPYITSQWVMRLADDDWLLPHHLETLDLVNPASDTDIIYAYDANHVIPAFDCNPMSKVGKYRRMLNGNWIDASATLIRTRALRAIGGWQPYPITAYPAEDWMTWIQLLEYGSDILCLPLETWCYDAGTHSRISNEHHGAV